MQAVQSRGINTWLLPDSIADVLPAEARRIEELRRALLDRYRSFGYELVMPPLLEYLESLLSASGHDLDLKTFKLIDQLSGRTLGLRADMTPQVTRIDAHLLNRQGVTRLCYCGSVLHTQPAGVLATREPLQIGAELYGHAGLEADLEMLELALGSLGHLDLSQVRLELSHMGILNALLDNDPAAALHAERIFALLQEKNLPAVKQLGSGISAETIDSLTQLTGLYGDLDVLERARQCLPGLAGIHIALDNLAHLVQELNQLTVLNLSPTKISLGIDLADLRGYHYHTGVMFSVFCTGWPNAVIRGGRYDDVGKAFGRARPATGFSLDLRELVRLLPALPIKRSIRAPWGNQAHLKQAVADLRAQGEIVVQILPGHDHDQDEFICDRLLVEHNGRWVVQPL